MGPSPVTVSDALNGVTRLGVDTTPLIYYVEDNPAYADVAAGFFDRIDAGDLQGFTSVVTLTEVLTQPKRQNRPDLEIVYRDVLMGNPNFSALPVDAAVAERAAGLRARHNLKTPDALQVATALAARCEAFLTNDRGLKRVSELRVLVLGELTA